MSGTTTPAATTTTTTAATTSRTWWWASSGWWKWGLALVATAAVIVAIWRLDDVLRELSRFDWGVVVSDPRVWLTVGVVAITLLFIAGLLGKGLSLISSIPFIPLLWVGVFGFLAYQIGTGIRNWMSQPTQKTQVVEFRSLTTSNVVGQQQTIIVGPLETWVLRTGTVTGQNPHPDWYWVCATSSLSILQGQVFITRNTGYNIYQYQFTEEARLRLVQEGISSTSVTYTYQIGRPGRNNPCDQENL